MLDIKKSREQLLSEIEAANEKIQTLRETVQINLDKQVESNRAAEFLCNILKSSLDSITVSDASGQIIRVNDAFLHLVGYTREEVTGKSPAALSILEPKAYESTTGEEIVIDEAFFEDAQLQISKLLNEGKVYNCHSYYLRKDGKIVPVEQNIVNIIDSRKTIIGTVGIIRDITDRRINERLLREAYADLQQKVDERTAGLEEANIALRVLLKGIDDEKKAVEAKIVSNVNELVLPYMDKIRQSNLDASQWSYLDIAERNLKDIISPFLQSLGARELKLTPIEIQVSSLIKQGKSSKQIAEVMHLSSKTIETHRKNIRNKLGLRNKKANLRAYLQTLSL